MKREREHQPPSSTPVWDPLRVWTFQNQIHCKGSKIEIILFSFYLTIPPQIYMSFNSCQLCFGISTYLLALFWFGWFFFLMWLKRELGCPRIKPPCRAKPASTQDSRKQTQQSQAHLSVPTEAGLRKNKTIQDKNNSPAHQSPKEMLWRTLHLFLLFPELGNSWAVTALCKTPALAEMGTFLRCPHGPEGNFSDMWDPLPLPSRDCPALQPLLLVEHWF